MSNEERYRAVLGDLRAVLARLKLGQGDPEGIIASRDQVFAKYKPIFSSDHIANLSRDEFTSFLYQENNCHWSGLYRKGLQAASNLDVLRKGLSVLLDEGRPISARFPEALDMVKGLGPAIATGILTVAYPEVYGVWNNTSESALRQVGLWPNFEYGEGLGGRYAKVNDLLTRMKMDLGTDFWTLDTMWWSLLEKESGRSTGELAPEASGAASPKDSDAKEGFALERQLEEFLLENWDHTPLAGEWAIYHTEHEPEAGNQFPTAVGPVDILAVHKKQLRLLVVELKRNQSTDQTVGQVLRYIGGVKERLKDLGMEGHSIEGLIIAHNADKKTAYALSTVPHVKMMTYEVEFRLKNFDQALGA